MDVTSDEIRSSRFQGTRHVYDRREVDAFLHRAAATLELYERKLAVTEAHVESLETALEMAHSRARSNRNRESRIAELETALAAAQHNYESTLTELETARELHHRPDRGDPVEEAEAATRSAEIVAKARQEASQMRAAAERASREAEEAAARVVADARAAAEELSAQIRTETVAGWESEVDALQAAAGSKIEAMRAAAAEHIGGLRDAAEADADAIRAEAAAEVEQLLRAAEADADAMHEATAAKMSELLAATAAEIDELRAVAQAGVDAPPEAHSGDSADSADSEESLSVDSDSEEVTSLRRQLAQARTALVNIRERFANSAAMSSQELEMAAALVDLELHDVGAVVDLTTADGQLDPVDESEVEQSDEIRVKSKWAGANEVPAGSLRGGRPDVDSGQGAQPRTWREAMAAKESQTVKPPAPERGAAAKSAPEPERALGFYERRLAGLRERLNDAMPDDS